MFATAPTAPHLLRKRTADHLDQPSKRPRLCPSLRFKVPRSLVIPPLPTLGNIVVDGTSVPASYVIDTLRNTPDCMPRNSTMHGIQFNELVLASTCAFSSRFSHAPPPSHGTIPILFSLLERRPEELHPRLVLPRVAGRRALLAAIAVIHGVWANAVYLGVVQREVWEMLSFAWAAVIRKMAEEVGES